MQRAVFLFGEDPDFALSIRFNHDALNKCTHHAPRDVRSCKLISLRTRSAGIAERDEYGLTQGVLDNQFVDELLDALLRGRDLGVARLGQDDRLDAEDLGRRAGEAAAIEVRADAVKVPLLQEQALLLEGLDAAPASAANSSSAALGIDSFTSAKTSADTRARFNRMTRRAGGRTGLVGRLDHRHQHGQPALDDLPAMTEIPADLHGVVFELDEFLKVGDLRDAQFLGALRADLGRVAVDRLSAAEDEVISSDGANRLGQDIARGERVAGRCAAVREQDGADRPRGKGTRGARRRPWEGPWSVRSPYRHAGRESPAPFPGREDPPG